VTSKQERIDLLERQIVRLQQRIEILDKYSTRYSWIRVAIFFGGLAFSVLGGMLVAWWLGVSLLVLTLLVFGIVAHFHTRIDRSLARHTTFQQIKTSYIARIKLNWQHIPTLAGFEPQAEHPFENDLDITGEHSLHRLLNVAISREGSQRLREWLLNTRPDLTVIQRRQAQVRELMPLTLFRDKLTMHSLRASRYQEQRLEGARLLNWLADQEPARKLLPLLLITLVLQVLTMVSFVLSLFIAMPQIWLFTLVAAVLLLFVTAGQRGDIFDDAVYLSYSFRTLSAIFSFLETYPYGKHEELKRLCVVFYRDRAYGPTALLKSTSRIASAATLKNNGLLWLIINAFVPWDIYCAYRLRQNKERIAARLPEWLDAWYELEALCSLATFAYLNPEYTMPEVIENPRRDQLSTPATNPPAGTDLSCPSCPQGSPFPPEIDSVCFEAHGLGHPLIPVEKKVSNDFRLDEPGTVVIITGSNMAGKSTFLRTLGVNLCLAYAGAPVCATMLRTTLFRLFSCIRVSDSVTDGYSYFYAEVRRLRALLTELEQPGYPLFFLIDEIFKGTNNRERLIGSRSFVHALVGRNCLGAISTHDLELVKLADTVSQVKNYHFREEVIDGQMVFDYHLRPGPCPTTNALKIMQMEGLPVESSSF
jgi:ABC-type multidrug transport system fused ATPase/permease subunit